MMFDNSGSVPPSRWAAFLTHLPVALAVVAAVALFVGLHVASAALVVLAVAHLVAAGSVWLVAARRRSQA